MTPPTWLDAAGRRRPTLAAGHAAERWRRCATGPTISGATAGRRRRRFKCRIGADARRSICRCPQATDGGRSCRSGSPTSRRTRCVGGSRPCRTGRVIRDPPSDAKDRRPGRRDTGRMPTLGGAGEGGILTTGHELTRTGIVNWQRILVSLCGRRGIERPRARRSPLPPHASAEL